MKPMLTLLPILLLLACGNPPPPATTAPAVATANVQDTTPAPPEQPAAPQDKLPETAHPVQADPVQQPPPTTNKTKPPAPTPVKTTPAPKAAPNDTLYHRYSDGRLSVLITPWVDRKREIWVFDPWGTRTFTLSETHRDYSQRVDLGFGTKGNLSQAVIHLNPGASMYTYTSTITFSQQNMPEWKTDEQFPMESLELPDKSYWDSKAQRWVKQEIVKEQPVPEDFRR